MKRSILSFGILLATLLTFPACGGRGAAYVSSSQSNLTQSNSPTAGELHFKAPDAWVKEQTTSSKLALWANDMPPAEAGSTAS
jgi:predicted small lipoprotein YifL